MRTALPKFGTEPGNCHYPQISYDSIDIQFRDFYRGQIGECTGQISFLHPIKYVAPLCLNDCFDELGSWCVTIIF